MNLYQGIFMLFLVIFISLSMYQAKQNRGLNDFYTMGGNAGIWLICGTYYCLERRFPFRYDYRYRYVRDDLPSVGFYLFRGYHANYWYRRFQGIGVNKAWFLYGDKRRKDRLGRCTWLADFMVFR